MSPRVLRLLSLGGMFVAGAIVATVAIYLFCRPFIHMIAEGPYNRAASTGKLYVRILTDIKDDRLEKAVGRIEMVLDSDIRILGGYEDAVPSDARDPNVYAAAALMREYRKRVPSTTYNPQIQTEIQRGLDLGTKAASEVGNGP